MLSSGLKSFGGVVRCQNAAFSNLRNERVKAMKKEMLSIQPAHEFLNAVKEKGAGVRYTNTNWSYRHINNNLYILISSQLNTLAPRNLLHLFRRSTAPKDFHTAVNGVSFYQRKGADFSHLLCSQFINLCVQNDKPKIVTDMIVQPHHRIGAWVSKKANLTLLNSLAKTDDVDAMVSVASATAKKGLLIQTKDSVTLMLQTANKAQSEVQFHAVMEIASKTLSAEDLQAIKAEFPAPAAAAADSPAVEEASA